jgi:Biotin-(acetyl-CoA carboxylase) ligase
MRAPNRVPLLLQTINSAEKAVPIANGPLHQIKVSLSPSSFFLILDPNLSGWFPIISGLSVQKALLNFDTDVRLKWPNDLILDAKKVGGFYVNPKLKEIN